MKNDHQKHEGFGFSKTEKGKNIKAHKESQKSKALERNNDIYKNTIQPLIKSGDGEKAEPILRLLAQSNTKIAEIYEELQTLCMDNGRNQEATFWRTQWLKIASKTEAGLIRQLTTAESIGDEKAEINLTNEIIRIKINDSHNEQLFFEYLLRNELFAKGRIFIEEKLQKNNDSIEWELNAALIYLESEKQQLASNHLKKYRVEEVTNSQHKSLEKSIELALKEEIEKEEIVSLIEEAGEEKWPENRILSALLISKNHEPKLAYSLTIQALKYQPRSLKLMRQKAVLHLTLGEWKKGFYEYTLYDQHYKNIETVNEMNFLARNTMGDALLWPRTIKSIQESQPIKINLYVHPPLVEFLKENLGDNARVHKRSQRENTNSKTMDIISLAGILINQHEDILKNLQQWKCNPELKKLWRDRLNLPQEKKIIALNWHGTALNASQEIEPTDIPLNAMEPINNENDIELIAIQKGIGSEQFKTCNFKNRFIKEQKELNKMNSIDDLAAVLTLCDWLICDDSGPAHLAGCLGVNTVTCLPERSDWRWPAGQKSPPWYPNTTIERKKSYERWNECLGRAWKIALDKEIK